MPDDRLRERVVGEPAGAGAGNGSQPEAAANGEAADAAGAGDTTEQMPSARKRTRAIVYVPHLGHTPGRSINAFATRLATVLNQRDPQRSATYAVEDVAETVRFGASENKPVAPGVSIVRKEGSVETAMGIYEFSYSDEFSRRFDEKRALTKALSLLSTVGLNLGRVAGSFVRGKRAGQGRAAAVGTMLTFALLLATVVHAVLREWGWPAYAVALGGCLASAWFALRERTRQNDDDDDAPNVTGAVWFGVGVALAGALLAGGLWSSWNAKLAGNVVLVVGVVWLLGAWLTLSTADVGHRIQIAIGFGGLGLLTLYAVLLVAAAAAQGATLIEDGDGSTLDRVADALMGIALGLAVIGIVVTPAELAKRLDDASAQLLAALDYLSHERGRDAQTGRLYALVEHLCEAGYTAVDVVGYSFGSIISLDALYRLHPAQVPGGTGKVIKRVVTIGSPVVTIATFWPTYWTNRSPSWKGEWINLYSPIDVLSSHVRGHTNDKDTPGSMVPVDVDGNQLLPKYPERVFPTSTEKLSAFEKLAVRGLKAHGEYWETPFNEDHGAVGMIGDLWAGPDWGPAAPETAPVAAEEVEGEPANA